MNCQPITFAPRTATRWTPALITHAAIAALLVLVILVLVAAAVWDILRPPCGQVTPRQWFALPRHERERRKAEFQAADEALQINSEAEFLAGVTEETETYHVLNGRVNDLWPTVPLVVQAMSTAWMDTAACRSAAPDIFFADGYEHPRDRQAREENARRICASCPVSRECREFAQALGTRAGIWAGEDLEGTSPSVPELVLCGAGLHLMTPENTKPIAGTDHVRCRACLRIADRRTQRERDARLRQRRREQRKDVAA